MMTAQLKNFGTADLKRISYAMNDVVAAWVTNLTFYSNYIMLGGWIVTTSTVPKFQHLAS